MKIYKLTGLLIGVFILCVACNNKEEVVESLKSQEPLVTVEVEDGVIYAHKIPILNLVGMTWTSEEKDYIETLNKEGVIKIATKISSAVYAPQSDGRIKGFHYNVLNDLARLLDVETDIRLVEWKDYFYKEGEDLEKVKSDDNYSYVPTLLEEVDLYIDGITCLPWREKMFDIIKFVPSKQLIVCREDKIPLTLEDLNNQTVSLVRDTSMALNLMDVVDELDLEIHYEYVEDFEQLVEKVAFGLVDFTILDSDAAFASTYKYDNLTVSMPISDTQVMGWGIKKSDRRLQSIIRKYLIYAQENKILDKYWSESYGVSFIQYLTILQLK